MQPYEIPAFAALKAEQRRLVWNAVVNGALEGWEPTVESVNTALRNYNWGSYFGRISRASLGSRRRVTCPKTAVTGVSRAQAARHLRTTGAPT